MGKTKFEPSGKKLQHWYYYLAAGVYGKLIWYIYSFSVLLHSN